MQNNTSISFTSKIRFISGSAYTMLQKRNYIDFIHNKPNILKADEFYSMNIRTCTGGGLVNPFVEAEGFHFWDDMVNAKNFPQLINSLFRFVKEPKRGLLVGSKDLKGSPYSLTQFENFKKVFMDRVNNVSLFQKHKFTNSETHYNYSVFTDTWTLCTGYREGDDLKWKYIRKADDLLQVFEKVSIADGDRLFIGKKEVLPSKHPELFKSAL